MPATVRSALAEKIETMTGEEAAAAADHYFDKNGKFLHDIQASVSTPLSVNEVTTANRFDVFTEPFADDDSRSAHLVHNLAMPNKVAAIHSNMLRWAKL